MIDELETILRQSFEDMRLSGEEKSQIRKFAEDGDEEHRRFMRNRTFDIYREYLAESKNLPQDNAETLVAFKWLERTLKSIDSVRETHLAPRVMFSPGDYCLKAIVAECRAVKRSLDICVFTISDNRITDAVIGAFKRGVNVRIITDDDKSYDAGSDIDALKRAGIPVRMDESSAHMHHKFAVVDHQKLLNGSFNWTRSASEKNQENILVSYDQRAIKQYVDKFNALWQQYTH